MCSFSRRVDSVSGTNIFARAVPKSNRQYLVYSMTVHAPEDLAMILPLPVPEKTPDDAVRFINLEKYPDFFSDLKKLFPEAPTRGLKQEGFAGALLAKPLAVIEVGSFEASFVPQLKDFARLDERFRLPSEIWDALPQYKSFGFAVFRLKAGKGTIHPMAFEFPRANEKQLFFPTVHIHDGEVHANAKFDHWLFCQMRDDNPPKALLEWRESPTLADSFMKSLKTEGIIDPRNHCYMRQLKGSLKNEDHLV